MEQSKIADQLYEAFYKVVPTRVMHFDMHRELAVSNALISARSTIKTLERIDGIMSRTCKIGSDPSEVLTLWKGVEIQLLIRQKEIKKGE